MLPAWSAVTGALESWGPDVGDMTDTIRAFTDATSGATRIIRVCPHSG